MKTGRTNHSIRPISVGELKWGNGASPDWSRRKCLSEGEHCMCVWNTGGALHKEKWMCIYIKSIKLLMGAVQPEGKIDRFTTQTHQYNLKHVFEAPPHHKRNEAGLNYCVHGFIMDHCSFTPIRSFEGLSETQPQCFCSAILCKKSKHFCQDHIQWEWLALKGRLSVSPATFKKLSGSSTLGCDIIWWAGWRNT